MSRKNHFQTPNGLDVRSSDRMIDGKIGASSIQNYLENIDRVIELRKRELSEARSRGPHSSTKKQPAKKSKISESPMTTGNIYSNESITKSVGRYEAAAMKASVRSRANVSAGSVHRQVPMVPSPDTSPPSMPSILSIPEPNSSRRSSPISGLPYSSSSYAGSTTGPSISRSRSIDRESRIPTYHSDRRSSTERSTVRSADLWRTRETASSIPRSTPTAAYYAGGAAGVLDSRTQTTAGVKKRLQYPAAAAHTASLLSFREHETPQNTIKCSLQSSKAVDIADQRSRYLDLVYDYVNQDGAKSRTPAANAISAGFNGRKNSTSRGDGVHTRLSSKTDKRNAGISTALMETPLPPAAAEHEAEALGQSVRDQLPLERGEKEKENKNRMNEQSPQLMLHLLSPANINAYPGVLERSMKQEPLSYHSASASDKDRHSEEERQKVNIQRRKLELKEEAVHSSLRYDGSADYMTDDDTTAAVACASLHSRISISSSGKGKSGGATGGNGSSSASSASPSKHDEDDDGENAGGGGVAKRRSPKSKKGDGAAMSGWEADTEIDFGHDESEVEHLAKVFPATASLEEDLEDLLLASALHREVAAPRAMLLDGSDSEQEVSGGSRSPDQQRHVVNGVIATSAVSTKEDVEEAQDEAAVERSFSTAFLLGQDSDADPGPGAGVGPAHFYATDLTPAPAVTARFGVDATDTAKAPQHDEGYLGLAQEVEPSYETHSENADEQEDQEEGGNMGEDGVPELGAHDDMDSSMDYSFRGVNGDKSSAVVFPSQSTALYQKVLTNKYPYHSPPADGGILIGKAADDDDDDDDDSGDETAPLAAGRRIPAGVAAAGAVAGSGIKAVFVPEALYADDSSAATPVRSSRPGNGSRSSRGGNGANSAVGTSSDRRGTAATTTATSAIATGTGTAGSGGSRRQSHSRSPAVVAPSPFAGESHSGLAAANQSTPPAAEMDGQQGRIPLHMTPSSISTPVLETKTPASAEAAGESFFRYSFSAGKLVKEESSVVDAAADGDDDDGDHGNDNDNIAAADDDGDVRDVERTPVSSNKTAMSGHADSDVHGSAGGVPTSAGRRHSDSSHGVGVGSGRRSRNNSSGYSGYSSRSRSDSLEKAPVDPFNLVSAIPTNTAPPSGSTFIESSLTAVPVPVSASAAIAALVDAVEDERLRSQHQYQQHQHHHSNHHFQHDNHSHHHQQQQHNQVNPYHRRRHSSDDQQQPMPALIEHREHLPWTTLTDHHHIHDHEQLNGDRGGARPCADDLSIEETHSETMNASSAQSGGSGSGSVRSFGGSGSVGGGFGGEGERVRELEIQLKAAASKNEVLQRTIAEIIEDAEAHNRNSERFKLLMSEKERLEKQREELSSELLCTRENLLEAKDNMQHMSDQVQQRAHELAVAREAVLALHAETARLLSLKPPSASLALVARTSGAGNDKLERHDRDGEGQEHVEEEEGKGLDVGGAVSLVGTRNLTVDLFQEDQREEAEEDGSNYENNDNNSIQWDEEVESLQEGNEQREDEKGRGPRSRGISDIPYRSHDDNSDGDDTADGSRSGRGSGSGNSAGLTASEAENMSIPSIVEEIASKLEQATAVERALGRALEESIQTRGHLEETVGELEARAEDLYQQLQEANDINQQWQQEVEKLRCYCLEASNQLKQYSENNSALTEEATALREHYAGISAQLEESAEENAAKGEEIARLQQELEKLLEKLSQAEVARDDAEGRYAEAEERLVALNNAAEREKEPEEQNRSKSNAALSLPPGGGRLSTPMLARVRRPKKTFSARVLIMLAVVQVMFWICALLCGFLALYVLSATRGQGRLGGLSSLLGLEGGGALPAEFCSIRGGDGGGGGSGSSTGSSCSSLDRYRITH